jgi:hypothetical protein
MLFALSQLSQALLNVFLKIAWLINFLAIFKAEELFLLKKTTRLSIRGPIFQPPGLFQPGQY